MPRLRFDCRLTYASGFKLDAAFEAGDGVTGLLGPSGSGKSTILALIAGLLRPAAGCIYLADRVLVDTAAGVFLPPPQRRIGVVFQDHLLFPHMSVEQNLRFGLGRPAARSLDFGRVAAILEIGDLLPRRPATLSGGQRQRVALGRALLRGPELLLMDEPLTGLEEDLKDRILTYLERAVAEWRIPTLFISHDLADVRRLAEQVVILEAGRVQALLPNGPNLDRALLQHPPGGLGLINLLKVIALRRVGEHLEGKVGDQLLYLPFDPEASGAYVQFSPRDVILSREHVTGLSVRNQLQGRVRELVAVRGRTFVAVDVGQFLWAEVTSQAAAELRIEPGMAITCLIKTAAMTLVK